MKHICAFILYRILGWKISNSYPKNLKKYVLIAAPHTSWQDFPIGIIAKFATGLPAHYIGKDSLFKPPFGFIFRALGGTPVDRSKNNNLVNQIVQNFNSKEQFILAMSPEGTRKKVEKWKTGFYYIAKEAHVPIVMATLDFEHKDFRFSEPYYPTDDKEADFKHFHNFFKDVKGKKPELG
ncbi:MAG: 1-acyl-sn-glycerol-3-phosphate acyltransferase [Flavobacteriaceae bacterium]|nr:1-acyl-sn-glycerol-3-phosphate acyltransferase [Flavobacteriaceae bacterium]